MKKINDGMYAERTIMRMFKGTDSLYDCVDFETKNALYEVKSCLYSVRCLNNNHLRRTMEKKCITRHNGRFLVKRGNHVALRMLAKDKNMSAKYVFVVLFGRQFVKKMMLWEEVNLLIDEKKEMTHIPIHKIFIGA